MLVHLISRSSIASSINPSFTCRALEKAPHSFPLPFVLRLQMATSQQYFELGEILFQCVPANPFAVSGGVVELPVVSPSGHVVAAAGYNIFMKDIVGCRILAPKDFNNGMAGTEDIGKDLLPLAVVDVVLDLHGSSNRLWNPLSGSTKLFLFPPETRRPPEDDSPVKLFAAPETLPGAESPPWWSQPASVDSYTDVLSKIVRTYSSEPKAFVIDVQKATVEWKMHKLGTGGEVQSPVPLPVDLVLPIGSDCSIAIGLRQSSSGRPFDDLSSRCSIRHQSGPFDWIRSQPSSIFGVLKDSLPDAAASKEQSNRFFVMGNCGQTTHALHSNRYVPVTDGSAAGGQELFLTDLKYGFVKTAATKLEDLQKRFDRLLTQLQQVKCIVLVYVHQVVLGQTSLVIGDDAVDEDPFKSLLDLVQLLADRCPAMQFCHVFAFNLCPYDFRYGPITHKFVGFADSERPWVSVGSLIAQALPDIVLSEVALSGPTVAEEEAEGDDV